jgi:hypothetical protein
MNRRLGILIFSVILSHLALFFFDFSKRKAPLPKKSLIVNTYSRPEPPPPNPRPSQKPPPEKSNNISQKVPSPVKKTPQVLQKQKVLKELGETLEKIEIKKEDVQKLPLPLLKPIESLQIDHIEEKQEETSYYILLASSLKEALELPELGKVKLELTLLNTGQVQTLRILEAESEKNKRYLEQQLIFFGFPPFTEDLKNERRHTFVLTFCNEK